MVGNSDIYRDMFHQMIIQSWDSFLVQKSQRVVTIRNVQLVSTKISDGMVRRILVRS